MPRYRFAQDSHIDDVMYAAGEEGEIDARHVPGPHWMPLDDAAKALCAEHGIEYTGEVPDPLNGLQISLAEAIAKASQVASPEALTKIVTEAVLAAQMKPEVLASIVAQTVDAVLDKRKGR